MIFLQIVFRKGFSMMKLLAGVEQVNDEETKELNNSKTLITNNNNINNNNNKSSSDKEVTKPCLRKVSQFVCYLFLLLLFFCYLSSLMLFFY